MQDDRVSKTPLWRQPVLWAAGAAVLLVVGGVGWMIYSAEELDARLDRQVAVADAPGRQAELEHAYIDSAAQDARHRESPRGGNSTPLREELDAATSAPVPNEPAGDTPTTPPSDVKCVEHAEAATVPIQQPPPSKPAEPVIDTLRADPPSAGSPSAAGPPPAEPAPPPTPPAKAKDSASANWLKCNENGEPYEAKLADGTVLKLDTYGDEYEGYHALMPIDGRRAQVVVDYQTARLGSNRSAAYLRLDVEGGRMYWIESGYSSDWKIRSAALSGRNPRVLLELRFQNPLALAIDHERGKLYWGNHAAKVAAFGQGPDACRAVWRANLDGSNPEPLFGGLEDLGGIAVEPASGRIFYFDGVRLVRGEADGTGEASVIDRAALPNGSAPMRGYPSFTAAIDPQRGKIYWCSIGTYYARANLDGTGFEAPFDIGLGTGQVRGIGLDVPHGKAYWAEGSRAEVWRTSLDGTQAQTIAVGMERASSVDVDSQHGYVYWTDFKFAQGDGYALIRRMKLPELPVAETMLAPPLVRSIAPGRQLAGEKVMLHGAHFRGTTNVRVIGDDGQQADAAFKVLGDTELSFVLPPRRGGVKLAAVVVQGPGGLTVTLPRGLHTAKDSVVFDRFRDGKIFCFNVGPGAGLARVEGSVVYASRGGIAYASGRGKAVLFLKDGASTVITKAPGVVVYHEPFARIFGRAKGAGQCEFVAVPAIRPSFVESLLEYEE